MIDRMIKVAEPLISDEEIEAVKEVLLSGAYVSGKKVEMFESEFAEYIGTNHAVAVNSGTAALHIALEGMGVGRGDEVIVPPMSFFATVSSVLYLGAVPVFADVDADNLCLSARSVKEVITSRTKAVIPVHLYGAAAKMDPINELADKYNFVVLEDCAQAHGTEYKKSKVGSIGMAGAFSFFATKHMTTGEGGMITTNDSSLAKKARVLRNHGMVNRDDHVCLGYNNRMTEMEAAMGLVQLKKLEEFNQKRIFNSEYLIEHLRDLPWLKMPIRVPKVRHTYFWLPVMLDDNATERTTKELKQYLRDHKIGFRERYEKPLYHQPVLKKLGLDYSGIFLKNAEAFSGRLIGLPNHPGLPQKDLDIIIDVIRRFN